METQVLKVTSLGGTPVFAIYSTDLSFKKVFGAVTKKGTLLWYFPAFYPVYKLVLKDLKALKLRFTISDAARDAITQLERYDERVAKKVLPPGFVFKTPPYDHQLEGFIHVLYNMRVALFYACGLGKTKIIVDWQRALNAKPLILCPRVVLRVWATEAARHGIEQEYRIVDGLTREEKSAQITDAKNYSGMVITYGSARLYLEQIQEDFPYNAIVADESHYIKDERSGRTAAALTLSKKPCRRVIMSGTPSTGDPRDMYSQFRFLSPCFMPESFWKFKQTFCRTAPMNKRIVIGYKNLHVLNERVRLVALRRTKKECLDLPEQHVIDVPIDMTPSQQKFYNTIILSEEFDELAQSLMREDRILTEQGLIDIPNAAVLVNKLLQVACGFMYLKADVPNICDGCEHLRDCVDAHIKPYTTKCQVNSTPVPPVVQRMQENAKLVVLLHKLDEILADPTHKCIIWAQFRPEMDWIEEAIKAHWEKTKRAFTLVRVDGRTTDVTVPATQFETDPACRVYLGQVETGVGITLNAANYMVYFSLPWKLLSYDQSIDRNHRVGQRRDVTVFRLLCRHTIDIHIARGLSTKRTVSETIISALTCAHCDRRERCADLGIVLFEEGCRYQRDVQRHVARAKQV